MSEATATPGENRTAPATSAAVADGGTETVDAVIVGAGFAGLYMLHRLRAQGLRVIVFEAGDDVGGTWYWNRYPGARVDVECINYSFSFSSDLEQDYPWAERYAPQPEILKYARHVADRFDLRRDIRFGARVTAARYAEPSKTWRIKAARVSGFGVPVAQPTTSIFEVSAQQRQETLEKAWNSGSLTGLLSCYSDTATSQQANDLVREFIHGKIRELVKDPQTAADLCPWYPVGTKRPCLDTGYYDAFNRDNVHLVNLRRTPLVAVTERGIRTSEREYEFDAIVYATGFDAMTGALTRVDIRGRGGASLAGDWHAGPRAYLGIASAGFPNLFMITGPGSPSVLSNMMISIEQHVDWVTDAIAHLDGTGLAAIEPTRQAQDAWVEHVNEVASYTLFPKANSWYMGANVPGKPRVFMPYAGGVGNYRVKCDEVARNHYEGFTLTT
jgi:cation diffusion facilitator CzcD-associated flavoprotein CzcO